MHPGHDHDDSLLAVIPAPALAVPTGLLEVPLLAGLWHVDRTQRQRSGKSLSALFMSWDDNSDGYIDYEITLRQMQHM